MSYWRQRANTWVSVSVLVGGVLSALILFFVSRVESHLSTLEAPSEEEILSKLEEKY